MATVVTITDRDGFDNCTDNIVVVEGHGAEARLTDLARVRDGGGEIDALRADAAGSASAALGAPRCVV